MDTDVILQTESSMSSLTFSVSMSVTWTAVSKSSNNNQDKGGGLSGDSIPM